MLSYNNFLNESNRSLTSGNKFKLFDYNSFNESVENTFKYLLLYSTVESDRDYIILSNDKTKKSHLIEEEDLVEIITKEFERPIKLGEEFYIFISRVDGIIEIEISLDPIKPTKDLIDTYDYLLKARLDDGPTGPSVEEIDGVVLKDSFKTKNDIKVIEDLMNTPVEKAILYKLDGNTQINSWNDEIVIKSIDDEVDHRTINNIKWKNPESNAVKSFKGINKFKL